MKRRNSSIDAPRPLLFDGPAPSCSATPPSLSPLKDGNRNHRRGFLATDGIQHRTPSSKSVDELMDKLLVPKYVTLSKNPPKLPRTRTTIRARVLEFEMYTGEYVGSASDSGSSRGSSSSDDSDESPENAPVVRRTSHSTESRLEYYESGVLRRMMVPENYSIAHLSALVCMVMGWPLATAIATSVLPAYRSETTAHRWGYPEEKEMWMHLVQGGDDEAVPSIPGKRRPEERVRLSDVWPTIAPGQSYKDVQAQRRDLHGLDTARIVSQLNSFSRNPLRDTDHRFYDQRPSSICLRIRCLSNCFYPLCLPSDEPNEIMGIGAVRSEIFLDGRDLQLTATHCYLATGIVPPSHSRRLPTLGRALRLEAI